MLESVNTTGVHKHAVLGVNCIFCFRDTSMLCTWKTRHYAQIKMKPPQTPMPVAAVHLNAFYHWYTPAGWRLDALVIDRSLAAMCRAGSSSSWSMQQRSLFQSAVGFRGLHAVRPEEPFLFAGASTHDKLLLLLSFDVVSFGALIHTARCCWIMGWA